MAKDEEVEWRRMRRLNHLNSYSNTVSKVNNYAAEIAPISIYKA